jgi:hypothetical protein
VLRGGADGASDEKARGRGWARAGSSPGRRQQPKLGLPCLPHSGAAAALLKSCARAFCFGPPRELSEGRKGVFDRDNSKAQGARGSGL